MRAQSCIVGSLVQMPAIAGAEVRSQELHPDLPWERQESKYCGHLVLPARRSASSKLGETWRQVLSVVLCRLEHSLEKKKKRKNTEWKDEEEGEGKHAEGKGGKGNGDDGKGGKK